MKNKIALIAGAALAFSVAGTHAGSVTFDVPGGGAWSLASIPWSDSPVSALEYLSYFQGGETIKVWIGTGYYLYTYQGYGVGTGLGFQSDWTDANSVPPSPPSIPGDQTDTSDGVYWAPTPTFTACQSFWLNNPNATMHMTLIGNGPLTKTVTLPGGGAYSFVGNATLSSGDVTSSAINLTANFTGGETVWKWYGTGIAAYTYQGAGVGTGLGYQSDWTDGLSAPPSPPSGPGEQLDSADGVYWMPPLTVNVAQGFYISNPNSAETWVQTINW